VARAAGEVIFSHLRSHYGAPDIAWPILTAIAGGFGGVASAFILARHFRRNVWARPFAAIALIWIGAGIGITALLFWTIWNNTDIPPEVVGIASTALTGAIGSGIMLWQFEPD
jgi:drug/metabolite transporter (DMT)-like permease